MARQARSDAAVNNAAPEWAPDRSAAANARAVLPPLTRHFFAAGRHAAADERPMAELHDFRLVAKRYRYTLELLRELYGPGLETRLDALKHVQAFLGEINDCVATGALLAKEVGAPVPPEVPCFLADRSAKRAAAFRRHWVDEFDRAGEEGRWIRYFQRPLRLSGRGAPKV